MIVMISMLCVIEKDMTKKDIDTLKSMSLLDNILLDMV